MNKSCQRCKQLNPPEAAFCLNCAAPLPFAPSDNAWQTSQQNQPKFGGQPAGQNFSPTQSGGASQRAIIAAVLALAGLVCCGPFTSIPAAIVGWMEVNAIKQGQSSQSGMWMAMVGFWGGIIITILQIVAFLFWVVISMSTASEPYYY